MDLMISLDQSLLLVPRSSRVWYREREEGREGEGGREKEGGRVIN